MPVRIDLIGKSRMTRRRPLGGEGDIANNKLDTQEETYEIMCVLSLRIQLINGILFTYFTNDIILTMQVMYYVPR